MQECKGQINTVQHFLSLLCFNTYLHHSALLYQPLFSHHGLYQVTYWVSEGNSVTAGQIYLVDV